MRVRLLLLLLAGGMVSCDTQPSAHGPDAVIDFRHHTDARGSLPVLAPALSIDETRHLRDSFQWSRVAHVPETDSMGRPTLWYVLVYLHSNEEVQRLRALDIHFSFVPLFQQERERWRGQAGVFTLDGDQQTGVFAFAFVPGVFINLLHDLAIDGRQVLRAVIRRDVPVPAAANPDGSLSYDYLARDGFQYNGRQSSTSSSSGTVIAFDVGDLFRAIGQIVAIAINGIREGFGALDRATAGSAHLTVSTIIYNTDPDFGGPTTPMQRTWGSTSADGLPHFGQSLGAVHALVQSHKGASLFQGRTDQFGVAEFDVAWGEQNLCVELSNEAVEVRNGIVALVVCNFSGYAPGFNSAGLPSDGGPAPDTGLVDANLSLPALQTESSVHLNIHRDSYILMRLVDHRINVFAQLTDGYQYARYVLGRAPRQAIVLTGFYADVIGTFADADSHAGARAFTWCNGYALNIRHWAETNWIPPELTAAADVFINSDIVLPYGEFDNPDPYMSHAGRGWDMHSRLVPTHEYGHFLMCDEIYSVDVGDELVSILEIWRSSQSPSNEVFYDVEAIADDFTMGVMRGANYFAASDSGDFRPDQAGWCPPAIGTTPTCIEVNTFSDATGSAWGRPSATVTTRAATFRNQVEWMASIFEDAYDGTQRPFPRRFVARSSVGVSYDGTRIQSVPIPSSLDAHDEEIVFAPGAWHRFWQVWSRDWSSLGVHEMTSSIAHVAAEEGYSPTQICQLFANHAPPDSSGAQSCHNLINEDMLRGAVIPTGPLGLTVERDPTTPTSVTFRWRDASTEATAFLLSVTDDAGHAVNTPIAPYSRSVTHQQTGLTPDTHYNVTVHTLNMATTSTRSATASFVTFSEPVASASATALPGAARVSWTPPTTPIDGTRVRMTAPFARTITDAPTSLMTATAAGLSSAVTYTFAVSTLNSAGEESVPRMVTTNVLAPTELFVAPWGADIAGAGTQTTPFRTLGAAIVAATASGATGQVIRVSVGSYVELNPLDITTSLSIIGGYTATPTSWPTVASGQSAVTLSSLRTSASGAFGLPGFNSRGLAADVAITVRSGATVTMSGLAMSLSRSTATANCVALLEAIDANLALDHVILGASIPINDGSCGAIVASTGTSRLSLEQTVVRGFDFGMNAVPNADLAGVFAFGNELAIARSTVAAIVQANGGSPHALIGVAASTHDVRVNNTVVDAWQGHQVLAAGDVAGVRAVSVRNLMIDDSIVRTPAGGVNNHALYVESGSTSTRATIVHSTLAAGDDALLWGTAPVRHHGAAIAFQGAPGAIRVVNSILSTATAGGTNPDATTVLAVMDFSALTRAPAALTIDGNVWSMPTVLPRLRNASTALLFCRPSGNHELANGETEGMLGNTLVYACGMSLASIDLTQWTATGNIALTAIVPDGLDPCPVAAGCSSDATCTSIGCQATSSLEFVTALDATGRPTAAPATPNSNARVAAAGVALASLPFLLPALIDIGGGSRCATNVQGAGAWILGGTSCP